MVKLQAPVVILAPARNYGFLKSIGVLPLMHILKPVKIALEKAAGLNWGLRAGPLRIAGSAHAVWK
jgi:hypothetical protein